MPGGGGGNGNPKPGGGTDVEALPEGSTTCVAGLVGCEEEVGGRLGDPKMLEKEKGDDVPVLGFSSTALEVADEGVVGLHEGAGWPTLRASSGSIATNNSLFD